MSDQPLEENISEVIAELEQKCVEHPLYVILLLALCY